MYVSFLVKIQFIEPILKSAAVDTWEPKGSAQNDYSTPGILQYQPPNSLEESATGADKSLAFILTSLDDEILLQVLCRREEGMDCK